MTPLHVDILLALNGAGAFGLPLANLLADLRRGRHRNLGVPQLECALRDLVDKSFVTPEESALGAERWRIMGHGKSALVEEGLA
jgi:hypothetical protein